MTKLVVPEGLLGKNIIFLISDALGAYQKEQVDELYRILTPCWRFDNVISNSCDTHMVITSVMSSRLAIECHMKHMHLYPERDMPRFPALKDILGKYGYHTYGISASRASQFRLREINPMGYQYVDEHYTGINSMNYSEFNRALSGFLEDRGYEFPMFFTLHYFAERIIEREIKLEEILGILGNYGINHEESIVVLMGDHGFPPNSSQVKGAHGYAPMESRSALYKENHGQCLDNYNTVVPLFLKFPGMGEGRVISNLFSQLDILPTILGMLGLRQDIKDGGFSGRNILDSGNESFFKNRLIRTDTRHIYDSNTRRTAITSRNYKYVYEPDMVSSGYNEEFYAADDYYETTNLAHEKSKLKDLELFREEAGVVEERVRKDHTKRIGSNISPYLKQIDAGGPASILVPMTCLKNQYLTTVEVLAQNFGEHRIQLLYPSFFEEEFHRKLNRKFTVSHYEDHHFFGYSTCNEVIYPSMCRLLHLGDIESKWKDPITKFNWLLTRGQIKEARGVIKSMLSKTPIDEKLIKSCLKKTGLQEEEITQLVPESKQIPLEYKTKGDRHHLVNYVVMPVGPYYLGLSHYDNPANLKPYLQLMDCFRKICNNHLYVVDHFMDVQIALSATCTLWGF